VANARPDQKACQYQVGCEPRFEGAERRVQPSKANPEIGNPDLELEGAGLPPDRLCHSCRKDDVAERCPQPDQSDREDESVSQQTIEEESTRHWPGPLAIAIAALVRAATHDSTGTIETTRFCQDRATWPHIATHHLPAQDRRTLGDVSLNILGRL
jgi:hypothetical protein